MTKRQIKNLNTTERVRLLKLLIDSFDMVMVTGLYGADEVITSKAIVRGVKGNAGVDKVKSNNILIVTELTTG